jgi:hypothetical protein
LHITGAPLAARPLEPLASSLRTAGGHHPLQRSIYACLDPFPINTIVVADAKDGFFDELVPVINSPDDYLNRAIRSVTLL